MPPTPATTTEDITAEQTSRATRTIEQKIAEAEARLARLRTQSRQLENGQKIILGGIVLAAARHDPRIRAWVTRKPTKPSLATSIGNACSRSWTSCAP